MGLCKCPKKKVTNQFCFEHRVNVCEYCLVSSHPRCIVKSYLHWLQDSDYNPVCTLCNGELSEGDVVRLVCYDVFHWNCINSFAASLPASTPPAGYTCPNCKTSLFPPEKMISPVCDQLRQKLSTVVWARAGLGMPVVQASSNLSGEASVTRDDLVTAHHVEAVVPSQMHNLHSIPSVPNTPQAHSTPYATPVSTRHAEQRTHSTHTTADVRQQLPAAPPATHSSSLWTESQGTVARKAFESRHADSKVEISVDHDENKYQRRGAVDWFTKWFGSRRPGKQQQSDTNAPLKRIAVFVVLVLLGLITTIVILTRVGRSVADRDPFLDPMANPNIRVHRRVGA